ncbi:MAG: UvrD-helicase domain-containing protein, partial [Candidatus Glassbacteria bacterium]
LAGAGSGKTFVITRRILHLVAARSVNPANVLAITFTRNAAREMARRLTEEAAGRPGLDTSRVTVRTFHSLCYLILRRHWRLLFDRPVRVVTDTPVSDREAESAGGRLRTKSELLLEAVRSLFEDTDFRIRFKRYLWDYMSSGDETDRFGGAGDPRLQTFPTLAGQKVRSWAERDIANWLADNGIDFRYDTTVSWAPLDFRPDFYLPGHHAFIEVWEIPAGDSYARRQKLDRYREKGIEPLEVFRDELLDFPALEKKLAAGLPSAFPAGPPPGGAADLERLESREAGYPEALASFLSLAEEVLDKLKNHAVDPAGLAERAAAAKEARVRSFYELFLQVYRCYCDLLARDGALDFNDLILQAVRLFTERPEIRDRYRNKFRYVLVDEYQDVNGPQVELLKQLVGPDTSLTCVGDDWQAIYGFRGSDVTHILEFEKEFPGPEVAALRVNYRNGSSIVALANHAVHRCRSYRDKPSVALRAAERAVVLYQARRLSQDGIGYVAERVRELIEDEGFAADQILVLYRRNSSWRMLGDTLKAEGLTVRHDTIHGAKGLEAPVVFLWAVVGGRGGFPSLWSEGGVLGLLQTDSRNQRLDEERRIFYVALTRAIDRLYVITEKHNLSPFLEGVPDSLFTGSPLRKDTCAEDTVTPCPQCGSPRPAAWRFCPVCFSGFDKLKA